jgi:hypothetical protein
MEDTHTLLGRLRATADDFDALGDRLTRLALLGRDERNLLAGAILGITVASAVL